jgi:hypothetical protein
MCDLDYPLNCKTNIYLKYVFSSLLLILFLTHIFFNDIFISQQYVLLLYTCFYKHNLCIIVSTHLLTT